MVENTLAAFANGRLDAMGRAAIVDVHPARADRRDGGPVWQVVLKGTGEDDDWIILWYPERDEAQIVYVGPDL